MSATLLDEFGVGDARERDESWRYSKTALRALAQQEFAVADAQAALDALLVARFDWPQTRGRRLVFVNGVYSDIHSDAGRIADSANLRHDGQRLLLTVTGDCAEPLHVVYASVPGTAPARWQAVADIDVAAGQANVITQYVGAAGADVLGELRSRIAIAPGAGLHLTTLSDLPDSVSHYRRMSTTVAQGAACCITDAIFGGRLQRADLNVDLNGQGARFESRGVFVLSGRQHADTHLMIRHAARDTACDVLWRGVADQRARGVFHGAITVAAGADGADARLSNKNLLLSAHAEIDTQPVLEIYADEVKAAHGATVGQLDETALFYLRSRGLPVAMARSLMIAGFCREAFTGVTDVDVRARLDALLGERLPFSHRNEVTG
ncbi:MAG TPA: Fe-S cluster assembly protein SufD [Rudaea sp.]|jgi:Fe-S cluster assembly protein SufD|nr:Fe-S cluster assembly protein SufD [Rudaea sp.]